jgi:parallel beta-helix repeat protein
MPHAVNRNSGPRRILFLLLLTGSLGLFTLPESLSGYIQPAARAAATFTVDSTGDGADINTADGVCDDGAGNCTLRAAIQQANATAGADTINFRIGAGVQTILLSTALPIVTDPVIIDGTTQPGYAGTPLVELIGREDGSASLSWGLHITAGGSTVRALAVGPIGGVGIRLSGAGGNKVESCYVGLRANGVTASPVGGGCVGIDDSANNTVGGTAAAARNVLSGCGAGVSLNLAGSTQNLVQGNYIGTNAAGSAAAGNLTGVVLSNGASDNTVGGTTAGAGNLISGNREYGITISAGSGNKVQGNYIGTNASGAASVPNGRDGVNITNSTNNVIGGDTAAARNVISGNGGDGVSIDGNNRILVNPNAPVSSGNVVRGNYIGTNAAGTAALPNAASGIRVNGMNNIVGGLASSPGVAPGNLISGQFIDLTLGGTGALVRGNLIGMNVTGTVSFSRPLGTGISVSGANALIGGPQPGARNVVSGYNENIVLHSESVNTIVQGNYIGTDLSGTVALGISNFGISVGQTTCQIGGTSPGAGNVISGNGRGISLGRSTCTVQGNFIGTDASGASPLPNRQDGVLISGESRRHVIGGTSAGAGNRIAFNGGNGIAVARGSLDGDRFPADNTLRGNSIFSNGLLGIDLTTSPHHVFFGTGDGVTFNDAGDADDGPNRLQNAPAVLSVESSGGTTSVRGRLDSAPSQSYVVDLYLSDSCDPSGYGEGQAHLGSTEATTDASGVAAFAASFPVNVTAGQAVTATATDSTGNTSEFSLCHEVNAPGSFRFISASFAADESKGAASVTVTRTLGTAGGAASVDYATSDGTAAAGVDYTPASGTLQFAPGETTKSFNVTILEDVLSEEAETVRLTLSNPTGGVTLGAGSTSVIKIDDGDASPLLTVTGVTVAEGDAGTTTQAVFTVRLSAPSGRVVTMDYMTEDDSASAPQDYRPAGGSLVFNPGETARQVSVTVNGDAEPEADERFFLFIRDVVNALTTPIGRPPPSISASAIILDEESPGIHFSAPFYAVDERGGSAVIRVVRRGDTSTAASASYTTQGLAPPPDGAGLASPRADYTYASGTLRFAPGETEKSITVLVNDDAYVEPPEAVALRLQSPADAPTSSKEAQLIIGSDDTQPPTAANNPLDDARFFVRQHYHDFLGREPDQTGFDFWAGGIEQCGDDAQCREVRRISVSAAFFLSIEFRQTGYRVFRFHRASFGAGPQRPRATPRLPEFLDDTQELGRGVVVGRDGWQERLRQNVEEFARQWVGRADFVGQFPATMTAAQFVDKLFANSGVTPTQGERDAALAAYGAGDAAGRAAALLGVTDSTSVFDRQYNPAFVYMQYAGYLRRAPDEEPDSNFTGFDFWLSKLDSFSLPGEDVSSDSIAFGRVQRAEMVNAFLSSIEYRQRFGR